MDILQLTSEDLIEAFTDYIEENFDQVQAELEEFIEEEDDDVDSVSTGKW